MEETPLQHYVKESRRLQQRLPMLDLPNPVPLNQQFLVLIPFIHSLLDRIEALEHDVSALRSGSDAYVG